MNSRSTSPAPEVPGSFDLATTPSPTPKKTLNHAASLATLEGYETATEDEDDHFADAEAGEKGDSEHTDELTAGPGDASNNDTVHHYPSRAVSQAIPLPETPQPTRRPRLHSRFASPRSSYSSRTSGSDYSIGADYALQTGGGAELSSSSASRPSQDLERSISLASIASGITDIAAKRETQRAPYTPTQHGTELERMRTPRPLDLDSSHIDTPTNRSPGLKTPTDSVLNSHADKVEVPGTIAQQFQRGQQSPAPPSSVGNLGVTPMNTRMQSLALKEQGNIVDKMQKENFKLKMKLYYLEKRLAQVTDEEVKRMINENIELSTYKISAGKEIRALNKTNRDLQFQLNERDARIAAYERVEKAENDLHEYKTDNEQELSWMRERISTYEVNISTLQDRVEQSQAHARNVEAEKQQLVDMVNSLSASRARGDDIELREETDLWKDLAESEAARKEQTIEENRKLREELVSLKAATKSTSAAAGKAADHARATSGETSSTEARYEQLLYENGELRREVGAQASMLRSRNRERDQLYMLIEDQKLELRKTAGKSTTGDSILERSASRAHLGNDAQGGSQAKSGSLSDAEREAMEALEVANGELRDTSAMVKMENQELSKQLETLAEEVERLADVEDEKAKLQRDYDDLEDQTNQEILALQAEKDEAWQKHDEQLQAFEELREEAQDRIDALDSELEQRQQKVSELERVIKDHVTDNENLRNEIRMISEGLEKIEADNQEKIQRLKESDMEIEELNNELESMDRAHKEASENNEKLSVELESRQSEIVFLREEQDTYIIRITELESSVKTAETSLASEQKRSTELNKRLTEERSQHQAIGSQEKKETSRMINDLNKEVTRVRDEARKLQKAIDIKESEVKTWKDRLYDLETGLKEVLGDKLTSKNGFVSTITQMQRNIEQLTDEAAMVKHTLALKEQALKRRDTLLENSALESKRLSDQLEKERSARTAERAAHEHFQSTHRHTSETINVRNTRIAELENGRQTDAQRLALISARLQGELQDRNELLLTLWHRLASICGTDFQNTHSLVLGHLPTVDVVAKKLPAFQNNLLLSVKTVEGMIKAFRAKIRKIEKDLTKDYSDLERQLDVKVKRLDRLESQAQLHQINSASAGGDDARWAFRLKELEKRLKAEREGRIFDRNGARQRLEEQRVISQKLRERLAIAEIRNASA